MKKAIRFLITTALVANLSGEVVASSHLPIDQRQEVAEADGVFVGKAICQEAFERGGAIFTRTVFEVTDVIKGEIPTTIALVHRGGAIGSKAEFSGNTPCFTDSAEYLLCVNENSNGDLTTCHGSPSARQLQRPRPEAKHRNLRSRLLVNRFKRFARNLKARGTDLKRFAPTNAQLQAMQQKEGEVFEQRFRAVSGSGLSEFQIPSGSPARPVRFITPDSGTPIPYLVDADYLPSGITLTEALGALQNALAAWTAVTGVKFESLGTASFGQSAANFSNGDGILRIQLHDIYGEVSSSMTLGLGGIKANNFSFSNGGSGGRVHSTEFHRIVNSFVILKHSDSALGTLTTFEQVLAHEVGHSLGLAHSSEDSDETDLEKKEALMYFRAHGDGRGADLRTWDTATIQKAYPLENKPPEGRRRHMDITTRPLGWGLRNPEVNQITLNGKDLHTEPSGLTITTELSTDNNGSFAVSGSTLTYTPSGFFSDSARLDPAGDDFYDRMVLRYDDGTHASPFFTVRVISFNMDTFPRRNVDGIPDTWISNNFASFGGDTDDPDGDGLDNLHEYMQRTTPDDSSSKIEATLDLESQAASEEDSTITLGVTLTNPTERDLSIPLILGGTATGSGTDFSAPISPLVIPAGKASAEIVIEIEEDADPESSETVVVTLGTPELSLGTIGFPSTYTLTITDDDDAPTYDFSAASYSVEEQDGTHTTHTVTLNRTIDTSFATIVDIVLTSGSATVGMDVENGPITVSFDAGETSKQVPIEISGDTFYEGDESLMLSFADFGGDGKAGSAYPTASLTITNDDPMPTISIADVAESEASGKFTFIASLSAPSLLPVSATYSTSNDSAVAGMDYTAASGSIMIPAGSSFGEILVSIIDDPFDEEDETFAVTLSSPTNASSGDLVATGSIQDDDPEPQITIADASADEGGGSVTITATLSAPSAKLATVDIMTADGSAVAGDDFTGISGQFLFPPGATTAATTISIQDDALDEDDESFTITLSDPAGATISHAEATATIRDDDAPPASSWDRPPYQSKIVW